VSAHPHRLERILDVVEQIRHANKQADHERAEQLNERLGIFLAGSPEKLLKTRELAGWDFSAHTKSETDALAADALDEIRTAVLALGPSPSWH
jgi:hypothetical protein